MRAPPPQAFAALREQREIVIPHCKYVPVTAVKYGILQNSLMQIEASGLLPRYAALIDREVCEQIRSHLAMSWAPLSVALAHYRACDNMLLGPAELASLGTRVGDRMQATMLVGTAKRAPAPSVDVWSGVASLHRMWVRHYAGGSIQLVKLGPRALLLEPHGFVLNQIRYFRQAQLSVMPELFGALGARGVTARILGYSAARDELTLRVSWS